MSVDDWGKYFRERRAKFAARGKCVVCGVHPPARDVKTCLSCRDEHNASQAVYRAKLRDELAAAHRKDATETVVVTPPAPAVPRRARRNSNLELADVIERAHVSRFGEVVPAAVPYLAQIRRRA